MADAGHKYRADIDGLRAIAVLAVVLYHYGIGGLKGGFVGVDVFFVISGFLITGIIHSEMQRGEFTLGRFYERRARRIFPALFAMLLATMVAGWFLLLPSDLARLGQASMATILFVSNGLYYVQSGYFDPTSEFNALLHTWSLGVEEQFYLGLPLLMLLLGRFWNGGVGKVLMFSALVSFVGCVLLQPVNFKAAFFLSPFRAWELLLGSLLGIGAVPQITRKWMRDAIALLSVVALLGSIAFMGEGIDFPGWKASIPVLATAALLHVGSSGGSRVSDLLAWKPLVFVGLISYSLYLWHWPLLVFVKYRSDMEAVSASMGVFLLLVALALAVASYYAVERPFRRAKSGGRPSASTRRVFAASGVTALALCSTGFALAKENGFPGRVPEAVAELDRARAPVIPFLKCDEAMPGSRRDCDIGAGGGAMALVWGDSHAMAWAPGMDELFKKEGLAGSVALNSACAPLSGLHNPRNPKCSGLNDVVVQWIETNKPHRVYLIAAWFSWTNAGEGYELVDIASGQTGNDRIFGPAFARTIQRIKPHVREIIVVGPTPGAVSSMPYKLAMSTWTNAPRPDMVSADAYRKRSHSFWNSVRPYATQVTLVDPTPWFCSEAGCEYTQAGRLLYRDGHHLNIEGSKFAARQLSKRDAEMQTANQATAGD